jgi:hypothetical protein
VGGIVLLEDWKNAKSLLQKAGEDIRKNFDAKNVLTQAHGKRHPTYPGGSKRGLISRRRDYSL